jgi:hypothetical protein
MVLGECLDVSPGASCVTRFISPSVVPLVGPLVLSTILQVLSQTLSHSQEIRLNPHQASMTLLHHYPVDHQVAVMTDIKPTTTYANAEVHSSNVRFMRSSSSSLKTLNSLATDQIVVLFTPAIPSTDGYEDPFECLGRSLSKRHSRVRHVPFVTKVGLTDLHAAWIRKAGAVVVVNCDPTLLVDTKTNNNMPFQTRFATQVADTLHSIPGDSQTPLCSVYISSSVASPSDTRGYDNVVVCSSYSAANLEKAASMLMC